VAKGGDVVFEVAEPETMIEGEVIVEGPHGGVYGECECGGVECGGAGCGIGHGALGGCLEGSLKCVLRHSEFFVGMQGFKGPLDNGENGNFGFHQGFNVGFPILPSYGIGGQIGATVTQSDLSGYDVQNFATEDSRNQQFVTIGLFERATECCPWQWGVVYDYMSDDIAETDIELHQLRGEIGYLFNQTGEIGFWFAVSDDDDAAIYDGEEGFYGATVETTDLYAFYYRHVSCEGNELRLWGGFSGTSDGLVGADFQMPVNDCVALRGSANYLIPSEDAGYEGAREESWAMGVSLVWYPGRRARCVSTDLYAPLLRPADNSTFMVDATNLPD
jgi:hypothetical protein